MKKATTDAEEFQCWICHRREPSLWSVRAAHWPVGRDDAAVNPERFVIRTRFICSACLEQFAFPGGTMTGFSKRGDITYRITRSKKPVKYDLVKYQRYLRRYGR